MAEAPNEGNPIREVEITLDDIARGLSKAGSRRDTNRLTGLKVTSEDADNWSKLLLIILMMATVLVALSVGSYKYLNLSFFCRSAIEGSRPATGDIKNISTKIPATAYINCPFDAEQQKDAGALVQSIVSGIIGIVAGMGIGSRKQ
jgi:hypothetical protein